jgi:RNA 2',3'-cyclic 3'-phosphodiesterase
MAKRLFAAIDIPLPVRKFLSELDPDFPGVRWIGPEQMHLTLAFFGTVEAGSEEKLCACLKRIEFGSFFLPLRGLGSFQSRGAPTVVWIGTGTGHPHLFQLHKRVSEAALAANIEPDLRPWHPHVTLARCRDASTHEVRKFIRQNEQLDAGMFPVNHLTLYSSRLSPAGSVYQIELVVPSSGSPPAVI